MSALADALVAAQRRALSAMEKAYATGALDRDAAIESMRAIGADDVVDRDRLLAALDVIREWGAQLPAESAANGAAKETGPMTDAQASYIDKLWTEHGGKPGDKPILTGLTKDAASKLISQLKTGTYNVADWDIPF